MTAVSDVPAAARCLGCRYPLRGLDGRRCPECGQAFDPADPASMRLPGRPPRRRPPVFVHRAADLGLVALGLTTAGRSVGAGT